MTSPLPEQVSLQRPFFRKKLMYLLKYLHVTALMNRSQQVRNIWISLTLVITLNDFFQANVCHEPWGTSEKNGPHHPLLLGLVGEGSSVGTGISWKDRLIGPSKEYTCPMSTHIISMNHDDLISYIQLLWGKTPVSWLTENISESCLCGESSKDSSLCGWLGNPYPKKLQNSKSLSRITSKHTPLEISKYRRLLDYLGPADIRYG